MITSKWHTEQPPKDGREIEVLIQRIVPAFWDDDLQRWVLSRTLKIDTLDNVHRWRPR